MTTVGRKPKPTALKKLEGNPGKRALNKKEPRAQPAIPQCPKHLKDEARKEWRRVSKQLHELGILTRVDRSVLAAYCTAWGTYVEAEEHLESEGHVLISEKGAVTQNPWSWISKSARDQMVKFAAEFGMTPSSRSRVKVEMPSEEEELERMLFGKAVAVK
jgi:P27 family predicted phage terminase small subunit